MKELYPFQKETVAKLLSGKKIVVAGCGTGKNPTSMVWAAHCCAKSRKSKILVVTTASKTRTNDHIEDFNSFVPLSLRNKITAISLLSWHKLAKWVNEHWSEIEDYVFVFDECQRAKAGVSSGMGKAFLKITKRTDNWSGWTGTPGDDWLSLYSYFTACNLVRNKTSFMNEYVNIQTFKGYPEIVGWRNEDKLKDMWARISFAPDTSKVMNELPSETHKTVAFKKPSTYNKIIKTRYNEAGEFLDTSGALVAELRRQCFTKDKQEWVSDFISGLESGVVMFYNYISTGDKLEEIATKASPKGARVWRIDGKHHEIPTADTFGERDVVLCQWQSGSEALNLQFLHYWVAVELCYSYSTATQGRGRIKRVGQKRPMFFYYLLTDGTIEQDILKCLKGKSEFSEKNWCISNKLIKEDNG